MSIYQYPSPISLHYKGKLVKRATSPIKILHPDTPRHWRKNKNHPQIPETETDRIRRNKAPDKRNNKGSRERWIYRFLKRRNTGNISSNHL